MSIQHYIDQFDEATQQRLQSITSSIRQSLPDGFKETMSFNMIGYVVPLETYPSGYKGSKTIPLPFINIGVFKHHIGFYHYGIYASSTLSDWFKAEAIKHNYKVDMGKSCIRLKHKQPIPEDLIKSLCQQMSVSQWIALVDAVGKK